MQKVQKNAKQRDVGPKVVTNDLGQNPAMISLNI
jgi:hypothetical protein